MERKIKIIGLYIGLLFFISILLILITSLSNDKINEIRVKYDVPLNKKIFIYGGNLGKPQGISFFIE